MPLTAERVMTGARDEHQAFDKQRTPDPVLLRRLSDYALELHGKVVAIDESAIALELVTPLPLADFSAGITLPANRAISDVMAIGNDANETPYPVDLIDFAARFGVRHSMTPWAAWVENGVLFLQGVAAYWNGFKEVRTHYAPIPVELVKLSDALPLPDTARAACVAQLAYFMARRGHTDKSLPPIDILPFKQDAKDAEDAFLADIANRRSAVSFQTLDVRGY